MALCGELPVKVMFHTDRDTLRQNVHGPHNPVSTVQGQGHCCWCSGRHIVSHIRRLPPATRVKIQVRAARAPPVRTSLPGSPSRTSVADQAVPSALRAPISVAFGTSMERLALSQCPVGKHALNSHLTPTWVN